MKRNGIRIPSSHQPTTDETGRINCVPTAAPSCQLLAFNVQLRSSRLLNTPPTTTTASITTHLRPPTLGAPPSHPRHSIFITRPSKY